MNIKLTKDFFLFLKGADASSEQRLGLLWDNYYSRYVEDFSDQWICWYILYNGDSSMILRLKKAVEDLKEICPIVVDNIDLLLEEGQINIHADNNALKYYNALQYYTYLRSFIEEEWPFVSERMRLLEEKHSEYRKQVGKNVNSN